MISVCLASYNGSAFIQAQIDSILPQLSKEDELLISDDGSTDDTLTCLALYQQDPRVKLIQGPKKGVIKNVEYLLTQARGEIIFLADQDDVWQENKVSRILATFDQYPDVEVVLSDLTVVDATLQVVYPSYFDYRQVRAGFFKNILKNSFIGAGMAIRRSLLTRALPFPKDIPMHDMWLGLVAMQHVYLLEEPLVLYRRHEQNASEIATTSSIGQKITWRYALIKGLFWRLLLKK